ncbi:MAG: dienelactone hydrolase family protein [Crocosphaera sp.]|nr:dienelactone hydrolase family protein [Crocosphaera sp.]
MRLFIALVLGAFLVVVGWQSNLFTSHGTVQPSDDYADYIWEVHHQEQPLPTDILTQGPSEEETVNVEIVTYGNLAGKPIKGYLASASNTDSPLPGIIVIHEWWGLNDNSELPQLNQRL